MSVFHSVPGVPRVQKWNATNIPNVAESDASSLPLTGSRRACL